MATREEIFDKLKQVAKLAMGYREMGLGDRDDLTGWGDEAYIINCMISDLDSCDCLWLLDTYGAWERENVPESVRDKIAERLDWKGNDDEKQD